MHVLVEIQSYLSCAVWQVCTNPSVPSQCTASLQRRRLDGAVCGTGFVTTDGPPPLSVARCLSARSQAEGGILREGVWSRALRQSETERQRNCCTAVHTYAYKYKGRFASPYRDDFPAE